MWSKIKWILFSAVMFVLLASCSSTTLLYSNWMDAKFSPDSLFEQTQASYYSVENSLSLKVFNNNQQLDLIIETNDPTTLEKIYRFGLGIWLDPQGRSRRVYGINFPLPNENSLQFQLPNHSSNGQPISVLLKNQYERLFQEMELVNFSPDETLTVPIRRQEEGVSAYLLSLPNLLFQYHLSISLDRLYPDTANLLSEKKLSIGISSVNEDDGTYQSSLSSKEVLKQRMNTLKAGSGSSSIEIEEQWIDFQLANP